MLLGSVLVHGVSGCGDVPNATIADEFHERLVAPADGWKSVPCPERAAKVERLRPVIALAHELRALLRDYDETPPPRLQKSILAADLRGRGEDYRCVIQDFAAAELSGEPDYQDVVGYAANVFMIKADLLLQSGHSAEGWAHVQEALAIHKDPQGAGVWQQARVVALLEMLERLLATYPAPAAVVEELIVAVDATRVPTEVACAAFRHEMLLLAVDWFRHHFDTRERTAMAQRFGLAAAMHRWQSHRSGKIGLGVWSTFREVYDLEVSQCTQQPFGRTIAAGTATAGHLLVIHPPVGASVRFAAERLVLTASILDTQNDLLAILRARTFFDAHGRFPQTRELAPMFGRRPRNAWDGRAYTFAMSDTTLTVQRGPHERTIELRAFVPAP